MKYLIAISVMIGVSVYSYTVTAAEFINVNPPIITDDNQFKSAFSYQTVLLPKWSFNLKFHRQLLGNGIWLDTVSQNTPIESVRVSASRLISSNSSQRLFAALQGSNHSVIEEALLYLPTNAGNAASFGWQLGDQNSLNMALEYEYREVGEVDINTLMMGVKYAF
ncbi:hypothetical protein [Alteromonas sp. ASW11-130]|uniref:hypothetical protein n=1 Tax=Alteromonas sp. ASW11-130 TaxID=3015775 RepID=UPI00224263B9|nr:hypothetical protein [Alteromonas sp. ASW11-130]MCW8090429.1 hypothetical protein [Alteromonas sp. ASW11-130]